MQLSSPLIWFGIITLFTQLIEAIAGFGATVVGLPFAVIFMSTGEASAILNLNAFVVTLTITVFKWKQINFQEYKKIVPMILLFLPVGLLIGSSLKAYDFYLKMLLGLLIVFISVRYFYCTKIKKAATTALKPAAQYAALISGAIVHGIFTTGGPLITLYTANKITDKGAFRATMCAVWTTVNTFVIGCRLCMGAYTQAVTQTCLFSLPFLAIGFALGMIIHKKIKPGTFNDLVYYLLLAGGLVSLYTGITTIL